MKELVLENMKRQGLPAIWAEPFRVGEDAAMRVMPSRESDGRSRDEIVTQAFLASLTACQFEAKRNGIGRLSEEAFDKLVYED